MNLNANIVVDIARTDHDNKREELETDVASLKTPSSATGHWPSILDSSLLM